MSRPLISTLPSSVSCRFRSFRSAMSSRRCDEGGMPRRSAPASRRRR
jgi:hypothetical protein